MSFTSISDVHDEKNVQLFAKQMLQGRLFIGTFQEKRYVDSLKSYRDVIAVAADETELTRDLDVVRKRIYEFYQQNHWIGITSPGMVGAPNGHCVWVELPDEIFGNYWYKISKIKFRPNETLVRVKVVRPVTTAVSDSPTIIKRSSNISHINGEENCTNNEPLTLQNIQNSLVVAKDATLNCISSFIANVATIQNTKDAIKFISVLFAAVVTGLIQLLQFFCDFTIKFMRESSVFIKAVTPIIIAFINLIGKIIGGFYLLILGMWRDRKGPPPIYRSPYMNRNKRLF